MSMSIRNQLQGTITDVTVGEAMATVKVRLAGGQDLTAAITVDAVNELGLSVGGAVTALVKSTDVALAIDAVGGLSIRNRLPGTVTGIATGAAMATVKISVDGGELDRRHHHGVRGRTRPQAGQRRHGPDQVDRGLARHGVTRLAARGSRGRARQCPAHLAVAGRALVLAPC